MFVLVEITSSLNGGEFALSFIHPDATLHKPNVKSKEAQKIYVSYFILLTPLVNVPQRSRRV